VPTLAGADNLGPSWSRDGQWIYFSSNGGGERFDLWKVPLKGGSPVQVTTDGGVNATESADGHFIYYSKLDSPGIWRMLLPEGDAIRILDQPDSDAWELVDNGIYFLNRTGGVGMKVPNPRLEFFEFTTAKRITISHLEKQGISELAVSPDGQSILFVQNEFSESSIMLVKNFQ